MNDENNLNMQDIKFLDPCGATVVFVDLRFSDKFFFLSVRLSKIKIGGN